MFILSLDQISSASIKKLTDKEFELVSLSKSKGREIFHALSTDLVAKVYEDSNALQYEVQNIEKATKHGIPCPKVYAFEEGPPAVLIMQKVDGEIISKG